MKAAARLLHTRHSPTGHTPQAEGVEGLQGEERERANQRAGIVPLGCTGDGLDPSRPSRGDQVEKSKAKMKKTGRGKWLSYTPFLYSLRNYTSTHAVKEKSVCALRLPQRQYHMSPDLTFKSRPHTKQGKRNWLCFIIVYRATIKRSLESNRYELPSVKPNVEIDKPFSFSISFNSSSSITNN